MIVLLIGPRGCGKSTLGRAVATAMSRSFHDLDDLVLAHFPQSSVSEVWAVHSESRWRHVEAETLLALLKRTDSSDTPVIALGGGTVMIPEARSAIEDARKNQQAACIYLHCDATELEKRLSAQSGDRPSLTGQSPAEEIATVLQQREPTYRQLADVIVDVSASSHQQAVDQLVTAIGQLSNTLP